MAGSSGGGRDGAPIIQQTPAEHPKGLLDAISELEYFHTQELRGAQFDGGFFTTKDKIVITELGFRSILASGLVTALLTPVAIGVLEKMIPVFGSSTPSTFDKCFVILLTLSYLIGYGCFLGRAVRSFYGEYTHLIVKSLLIGIVTAAIFKMMIVFILFHFLYIKVLTQENIVRAMAWITKGIRIEKVAWLYHWLMDFRPVLLTSALFVVMTTTVFLAVIIGCYISALRRNRTLREAGLLEPERKSR